jgi:hypothetical protein
MTGIQRLDSNEKYLNKFLSYKGKEISPSDVSRYRLMPPTQGKGKNKYPVEECKNFMKDIESAGFGSLSSDRRSVNFRKRQYSELGSVQQENLKRMNLSMELYDSFLMESDDSIESAHSRVLLSTPDSEDSQELQGSQSP